MKRIMTMIGLMTVVMTMSAQEIKGPVPTDRMWHAGMRYGNIEQIKERSKVGIRVNCYKMGDWEVLVVRNKKTGSLIDVYRCVQDNSYYVEEIINAYLSLLSGMYQNETGISTFGSVKLSHEEIMNRVYAGGDPGGDLMPMVKVTGEEVNITDILHWGERRVIHRHDTPRDAPPGWGGNGAMSGPTTWKIHFTDAGLSVEEVDAPERVTTYPAFGKKFVLKKIRGPYEDSREPWAIASKEPLVRDLLKLLAPRQLNAMLDEIKKCHTDGSQLTSIEKLNRELIRSVLASKTTRK